jgi:hypothetical protein
VQSCNLTISQPTVSRARRAGAAGLVRRWGPHARSAMCCRARARCGAQVPIVRIDAQAGQPVQGAHAAAVWRGMGGRGVWPARYQRHGGLLPWF